MYQPPYGGYPPPANGWGQWGASYPPMDPVLSRGRPMPPVGPQPYNRRPMPPLYNDRYIYGDAQFFPEEVMENGFEDGPVPLPNEDVIDFRRSGRYSPGRQWRVTQVKVKKDQQPPQSSSYFTPLAPYPNRPNWQPEPSPQPLRPQPQVVSPQVVAQTYSYPPAYHRPVPRYASYPYYPY